MCEKCDIGEFQRFDTYQTHEAFDLELTKKLGQGILVNKGIIQGASNTPTINFKEIQIGGSVLSSFDLIQCSVCNQKYHYSFPDNAWRGFYLKEENHPNTIEDDVKQRRIKLALKLIIIAIITYILLK